MPLRTQKPVAHGRTLRRSNFKKSRQFCYPCRPCQTIWFRFRWSWCSSCAYWPLHMTSFEKIRISDCQEGWTESCQCSNSRNWSDDSRKKQAKSCCERFDQKISFKNNLGLREAVPLACGAERAALHARIGRPGPRRRAVRTPGGGQEPPPPGNPYQQIHER